MVKSNQDAFAKNDDWKEQRLVHTSLLGDEILATNFCRVTREDEEFSVLVAVQLSATGIAQNRR